MDHITDLYKFIFSSTHLFILYNFVHGNDNVNTKKIYTLDNNKSWTSGSSTLFWTIGIPCSHDQLNIDVLWSANTKA